MSHSCDTRLKKLLFGSRGSGRTEKNRGTEKNREEQRKNREEQREQREQRKNRERTEKEQRRTEKNREEQRRTEESTEQGRKEQRETKTGHAKQKRATHQSCIYGIGLAIQPLQEHRRPLGLQTEVQLTVFTVFLQLPRLAMNISG